MNRHAQSESQAIAATASQTERGCVADQPQQYPHTKRIPFTSTPPLYPSAPHLLLCFLSLSLLIGLAGPIMAVEIIAHRGAAVDAPENTLPSFRLGWEQNADACELDIWLSKDGKIVVIHDENTERTAGVEKKISEQTLAELQSLDVGASKELKWAGTRIPTLTEVLAIIPPGKRLFIEIKCGPEILPELKRVIQASRRQPSDLVIIGFGYETIRLAKKIFPDIPVCFLSSFKHNSKTNKWTPSADKLIEKAKAAKLDGLDLHSQGPVNADFVKKVKAAKLKLYIWTVDEPSVAKKLADDGVDGITTNRPGWLREQIK
jgi:glycerophosphoryl diester phosphodiesterase